MKKTLVALAALAAVGTASAQVTITGYFGASYDSFSLGSTNVNRLAGYNTSENRVSDQASRIIFGVTENLNNDLSVIGQFDLRFKVDATTRVNNDSNSAATGGAYTSVATATAPTGLNINYSPSVDQVSGGNNHIGLRSKSLGTLKLGRQDIYYTETASLLPGGLFLAANQSPIMHLPVAAASNGTMGNWSRTPNLMWYESNRISGFQATLGYSTGATRRSGTNEVENDVGTNGRKGSGTYFRINYTNGPIDATIATISLKSDYVGASAQSGTVSSVTGVASAAYDQMNNAVPDQSGTVGVLKYQVNPSLRVSAAYSDNKATTVSSGSATSAKAQGYSVQYALGGNHFVTWNYARRANAVKDGVEQADTNANMTTLAYHYDFTKRTAVGVMWTQLKNASSSATGLFYQGNNAYGGQGALLNGETSNITSVALRHNF